MVLFEPEKEAGLCERLSGEGNNWLDQCENEGLKLHRSMLLSVLLFYWERENTGC